MSDRPEVLDLFAGPGGWSVACAVLGLHELGVELDPAACSTRAAAGFETLSADVSTLDPGYWRGVPGLIASPPCQAFSMAGKKTGHDYLPELVAAIRRRDWSARPSPDPRVWLVLEVGRWLEAMRPEWVALEQVPAVLPLWQEYSDLLRADGYSVWVGKVNAADYGVPQVRIRAVLLASRVRVVPGPPPETHAKTPVASLFGTPERWVTMAEALGWGMTFRPAFTFAPGTAGGGPDLVGGSGARRGLRSAMESGWTVNTGRAWGQRPGGGCQEIDPFDRPAPAFTSKTGGQWHLNPGRTESQPNRRTYDPAEEPAPTIAFGHDAAGWEWQLHNRRDSEGWIEEHGERPDRDATEPAPTITGEAHRWTWERPATTLQGDPRIFHPGGHIAHDGRDNTKMKGRSEDAVRVTVADALALQSFPEGFPVRGSKTKQFEQIGNAVPPLLAWHLLRWLTGRG